MVEYFASLKRLSGNDKCADCEKPDPDWVSYNLGIFICERCAGIHKSLGSHISKLKPINDNSWIEEELQLVLFFNDGQTCRQDFLVQRKFAKVSHEIRRTGVRNLDKFAVETYLYENNNASDIDATQIVRSGGNNKSRAHYEQHVPKCYHRPHFADPPVMIEQWIHAKYERGEFLDPSKQNYITGHKEGFLWKRGKDANKFAQRRFVLSGLNSSLMYFVSIHARVPKGSMQVDRITLIVAPEKLPRANGMQLMYTKDNGKVRNIYVCADTGADLISWYTAIRHIQLSRLYQAYPFSPVSELVQQLSNDVVREGWLYKTGPQPGSRYRKRWMTLVKRQLIYYAHPLDAHPLGIIFIGSREAGYTAREGVPPGVTEWAFMFTLKTPTRMFHLSAETAEERASWLESLQAVIASQLSPIIELRSERYSIV